VLKNNDLEMAKMAPRSASRHAKFSFGRNGVYWFLHMNSSSKYNGRKPGTSNTLFSEHILFILPKSSHCVPCIYAGDSGFKKSNIDRIFKEGIDDVTITSVWQQTDGRVPDDVFHLTKSMSSGRLFNSAFTTFILPCS